MGRGRLGALIGVAVVGGVLALGLVDCAEPTQIEIDVRTDACGVLKNAGIAVSAPERIDTSDLTIFTPDRPDNQGCEGKPADRVGTLIIYPSGAKDGEVGIRIVGGISRTAQECKPGDYAGCVVARRIEKFVSGSTKKVIVILSRACEGKDCGLGKECNASGSCVVSLPDGGTEDGGTLDAQIVSDAPAGDAPADAPNDAIFDAGADACGYCVGGPGTTCNAGKCTVACNDAVVCANKPVCGLDLDCTVNCNFENACNNTSCAAGSKSCAFNCINGTSPGACNGITCLAPVCSVSCNQSGRCNGNIVLAGGDASITCEGTQGCANVDSLTCDAGQCNLVCNGTCPGTRSCNDSGGHICNGPW